MLRANDIKILPTMAVMIPIRDDHPGDCIGETYPVYFSSDDKDIDQAQFEDTLTVLVVV